MTTIKLHKDFLVDELELPYSAIKDKITDTSRWSEHHEIIFNYDGKFYRTYYSQGLTEYQDEAPFENSPDEIECTEVELVEKTIKIWQDK